jgi:threonine-phosphate decarboxylase
MLNGHGDNLRQLGFCPEANFSSNVSIYRMPDVFYKHIAENMGSYASYPDPCAADLAEEIASLQGTSSGNILVCNGATEAIYLIAQAFGASRATACPFPSFSEYEDACKIHKHNICFVPAAEILRLSGEKHQLVWICNPNNPCGTVLQASEIAAKAASTPGTVFVIDEAYSWFSPMADSLAETALQLDNMLVIKSLTKQYAIPGLRLGYAIGSKKLISKLMEIKMPWSVNSAAINAGLFIAQNSQLWGNKCPAEYQILSAGLQKNLASIEGITVLPSSCNYFLCQTNNKTATELSDYLLSRYRILIRIASNFRGLGAGHFRIAAQNDEKNKLLIKAMGKWGKQ